MGTYPENKVSSNKIRPTKLSKELFDQNFKSTSSNGYFWGKDEGHGQRKVLDPSKGQKEYPDQQRRFVNLTPTLGFGTAAAVGATQVLGPIMNGMNNPVSAQIMNMPRTVNPSMLNIIVDNQFVMNSSA